MSGPALSSAASAMLRALIGRCGVPREQVMLSEVRSVEWHSLTFDGERHRFALRILAPHAETYAARMIDRLDEAEFVISGLIVADIHVAEGPCVAREGSVALTVEALTLAAD